MALPPPGVDKIYDYSDPLLRTTNASLAAVGMGVSTACLAIRLYTKAYFLHQLGWDDICIVTAWAFAVASQGVLLHAYAHSWIGTHLWDLTEPMITGYRKTMLSFWIVYTVALAFSKIAVLMLYLRLFVGTPLRRFTIWLTAGTIVTYSLAFVVALILACSPISRAWDDGPPGGCMPRTYIYLGTTIANTISDIILILIPIPVVHELHLALIEKVGVMFMFGVGCLTVVVSIVRLATVVPLVGAVDQPNEICFVIVFIIIEANVIIVCGTLPYLRHFARHYCSCLDRGSRYTTDRRVSSDDTMKSHRRLKPVPPEYDIELAMRTRNCERCIETGSHCDRISPACQPPMPVHLLAGG